MPSGLTTPCARTVTVTVLPGNQIARGLETQQAAVHGGGAGDQPRLRTEHQDRVGADLRLVERLRKRQGRHDAPGGDDRTRLGVNRRHPRGSAALPGERAFHRADPEFGRDDDGPDQRRRRQMGQHLAGQGRHVAALSGDDGDGHHENDHRDGRDHDQPGGRFFQDDLHLRGLAGLHGEIRLPVAGARLADVPARVEDRNHPESVLPGGQLADTPLAGQRALEEDFLAPLVEAEQLDERARRLRAPGFHRVRVGEHPHQHPGAVVRPVRCGR